MKYRQIIKWKNSNTVDIGKRDCESSQEKMKWDTANCPLNDNCLVESVVYRATIEPKKDQGKVYIASTDDFITTDLSLSYQGTKTTPN